MPQIWPGYAANSQVLPLDCVNNEYFKTATKFPGSNVFSKFMPILYPNKDKQGGPLVFLRVRELAMVSVSPTSGLLLIKLQLLRGLLFGRASVVQGTKAHSREKYGELWGLSGVTPGAIAFVAVVVIFLLNYT